MERFSMVIADDFGNAARLTVEDGKIKSKATNEKPDFVRHDGVFGVYAVHENFVLKIMFGYGLAIVQINVETLEFPITDYEMVGEVFRPRKKK